jgi:L-fucose isomerase-like protein
VLQFTFSLSKHSGGTLRQKLGIDKQNRKICKSRQRSKTMQQKAPLLGLCPIGKFVFSNQDAIKYKKLLQAKLRQWQIEFVDLDDILEDGLVKDQSHVDTVVKHFRDKNVDCLFMPHCNFGTEGAVGMIGKKLQLPVLLWGPRDEAPLPDGTRLRDSLCGMFASSKVLHKLNVPFTYIENCRIDDQPLKEGIDTFLRASAVANIFRKGARIGQVGQRIDFFWTTICNESELLERFNIEVLPIPMVPFLDAIEARLKQNLSTYKKELTQLRQQHNITGFDNDTPLLKTLACRDHMLTIAKDQGLDAFTVEEFMALLNALGTYPSYAEAFLANHYPLGYESDIHGAISDLILRRVSLNTKVAYLADVTIRHPENDNAVLLWHGGAPFDLCHHDSTINIGPHWILPSPLSGMPHFRLQDGPITVARFDGDHGNYQLAIGQGNTIPGPHTLNTYTWMQVDNWLHWERTLIQGPFIHHVAMIYQHYANALTEACKYIPNLTPIKLKGSDTFS